MAVDSMADALDRLGDSINAIADSRDAARRERDDLRHQRDAYEDALTDITHIARGELADPWPSDEPKSDTVGGRAYAAVGDLVRERDELRARLTRKAATHAARQAEFSRLVADLQGQLRDADATAAGLRVEASEAAMAAAVGEAVVAALHGEDVSDFMQSFGPVMEAQTMAHTIALLHGDVEAQRRVIVDACAVLRVTDDAEEDWPKLPAAVADLAARLAEVEATLANERGEGEPVEGWTWALEGDIASTCWHHPSGAVVYLEPMDGPIPPGHAWMWWVPGMPGCQSATTARAAMRAASERLRGTP